MSLTRSLSAGLVLATLAFAPALARADAHGDALAEADRLEKKVEQLYAASKYAEALPLAKRELAIREKELGPSDGKTASAASDVGAMYLAAGELHEAEAFLKRAVDAFEKASPRDDDDFAAALGNLAALHLEKNQAQSARPFYQRAIEVTEKSAKPNQSALATYSAALAAITVDLGQASKLFEVAIAIHEKVGPERALVVDLAKYGNFLRANAKPGAEAIYRRAYELSMKALGPAHKLTGEIRRSWGRLFWGAGDGGHAEGERIYKEGYDAVAAAIGPTHPEVAALMQDWAVMKQIEGDLDGSLEMRRRADRIEEKQLDRMLEAGTEADRLDYARKLYSRVDYAVELALSLGQKSKAARRYALELVLKRKGQVLDAMAGGIAALRAHATPDEQRLLAELAGVRGELAKTTIAGPGGDLAGYRGRVADLEKKENALEAEVGEKSVAYRRTAKPLTLEAVQAALPEGAALVEILRWNAVEVHSLRDGLTNGERYIAFVVKKGNDPYPFILGDAREIDSLSHEFRAALSSPGDRRVYDVGERLNHYLLLRLEPALEGVTSLFVAPDGELNLVPFGALVDMKKALLVESYAFTYLSSGRDLLRLGQHRQSVDPPTILANPRYDAQGGDAPEKAGARGLSSEDLARMRFPPLPGTQAEADAIAKIIPNARILTGDGATEGAIKAVHAPSILHVATHGFFLSAAPIPSMKRTRGLELAPAATAAPSEPRPKGVRVENPLLRSGLAFAGANARKSGDDDGVLTALEASDLDLEGTRLVVLSACETGVGDVQRGQGVFSLRRALVEAGAETQVMSLWEVDDEATKNLMTGYYTRLFKDGKGRSEALREVQLAMLAKKESAHPFYWSAFIVSGDPSPLPGAQAGGGGAKGAIGSGEPSKVEPGARGCGCSVPPRESGASPILFASLLGLAAWVRFALREIGALTTRRSAPCSARPAISPAARSSRARRSRRPCRLP